LTSLTFDTKKIEKLIIKGLFDKAAEELFEIIEDLRNRSDKELIYKSLSLLNLICDKSPSISERIIHVVEQVINDTDSWIRLVALEILYQISIFRPNLLIILMEKIRARLFDKDPSVRRLTVKLIGNLILSLHIDKVELQELIEEYTEKLMDNDWKVKFLVIKTIQKILNQDYTKIKDLEPLLSIVIINLRDEDSDVARAAAELLKILGLYFLSKDKIFYVLLNLLYNEKSRVKELIIWLFGEIGKERSSEIIPHIPKLLNLLKGDDYRIQLKVIDALVSISENNFDQIWSNLINSLDTSDNDLYNNAINALYRLGQKHITDIFNYLFEELENPSEKIREGIALVFQRLFEEYQIEIENEITKILYKLESKYWRERKKTIFLLQNICFILKNHKIAVWITIELNKILKSEMDLDVKKEIHYTLDKIKVDFKEIDKTIKTLDLEVTSLEKRIYEFQRIPAEFRRKINSLIKEFKFDESEVQLNRMYTNVLKKIKKFHNRINNFEYKRLAFDLIEEWEETKIQIIDELSIVKGFISEIVEEKKTEFLENLLYKVKSLDERINVLNAQFDNVKGYSFNINLDAALSNIMLENEDLEGKFSVLTQIRKNLFKLDVDIRELFINNLEFSDIFKALLRKWITVKISIQEYLGDLDHQIKVMKEEIVDNYLKIKSSIDTEKVESLRNELAFQLLQGHIQSVFSHGMEVFKKFNDSFDKLSSKIELLIKKKEFVNAKQLLEMNSSQIQNFIEETEQQIDKFIGREKIFQDNNVFNLFVRPYLEKWNASKELVINKLKTFLKRQEDILNLSQFKYYLKVMNPIKLRLLSTYVGMDVEQLKEVLLNYINKDKLKAKIVEDSLYSLRVETGILDSKNILFFKNIKSIGNKIFLNFKLNNPTNFDFKDIQISLKVPTYLRFLKKESFPRFLNLPELRQGSIFKFNYVLKINKKVKKDISDPNVDEIKLDLYYRDPFNFNKTTTKKINILLP
jgi:HEAT repeat protein